jgi:hypothetical protein
VTRNEYRKLFDGRYKRPEDVFQDADDRFVIDQLIMFFGFSEPNDYFELPRSGKLTLALGNFDEAFRVGGVSEFLENCGYCVPEMPEFLREVDCPDIATVMEAILNRSNPAWWGGRFFEHQLEVTQFARTNEWFRKETEQLRAVEPQVIPKTREYLKNRVELFRNYQV